MAPKGSMPFGGIPPATSRGGRRTPRPGRYSAAADSSAGRIVASITRYVTGPAKRVTTLPSPSITKVSGTP